MSQANDKRLCQIPWACGDTLHGISDDLFFTGSWIFQFPRDELDFDQSLFRIKLSWVRKSLDDRLTVETWLT